MLHAYLLALYQGPAIQGSINNCDMNTEQGYGSELREGMSLTMQQSYSIESYDDCMMTVKSSWQLSWLEQAVILARM